MPNKKKGGDAKKGDSACHFDNNNWSAPKTFKIISKNQ